LSNEAEPVTLFVAAEEDMLVNWKIMCSANDFVAPETKRKTT
jgi:hypothetical protein